MAIKTRFENFSKNIRPKQTYIDEATRQIDYMIEKLHDKVSADSSIKLKKVLKAGSNAKATSLRPEHKPYDVDLGAYFVGEGVEKDQLNNLLEFTQQRLFEIYQPQRKPLEDFVIEKSAVRVKFRSNIKLNVDVAPIICDDQLEIENGGWIPRSDGWRLTSVTRHIKFVSDRTVLSRQVAGPVHFNRLVRMMKWWNALLPEDLIQPSIMVELLTADAFQTTGVTTEWKTSLIQIFRHMLHHDLRTPIVFDDCYDPKSLVLPKDPVVALDSVNPDNNVAHFWTEAKRQEYMGHVQDAYDALMDADSAEADGVEDEAVDAYCRVFGEAFRTLSERAEE